MNPKYPLDPLNEDTEHGVDMRGPHGPRLRNILVWVALIAVTLAAGVLFGIMLNEADQYHAVHHVRPGDPV